MVQLCDEVVDDVHSRQGNWFGLGLDDLLLLLSLRLLLGRPDLIKVGLELLGSCPLLQTHLLYIIESLVWIIELRLFLCRGLALRDLALATVAHRPILGFVAFTKRTVVSKLVEEMHVMIWTVELAWLSR